MQSNAYNIIDTPEKRATYLDKWLNKLCHDVGVRPPGSQKEYEAGDLLEAEMQAIFGNHHRDWYQMMAWELINEPQLLVDGQEIETYMESESPSTPDEGYNGRLISLNEQNTVFGLIVEGWARPAAIIKVNPYGPAAAYLNQPHGGTPTFGIGKQDVPTLKKAITEEHPVMVVGKGHFLPGAWSSNIVGKAPGRTTDELVFCAHYDTQYISPGANDNTASLITMLLLARSVAHTKPSLTITFVATGAEEAGSHGAWHYVQTREREGTSDHFRYCINFDSLTYGPNMHFQSADADLLNLLKQIHGNLNLKTKPIYNHNPFHTWDDQPFFRAGATSLHVNSRGYDDQTLPVYHRPYDLPDTVHAHLVEDAYIFFMEVICQLAKI